MVILLRLSLLMASCIQLPLGLVILPEFGSIGGVKNTNMIILDLLRS